MKRSGIATPAPQKPRPKSSRKTMDTNRKEADASRLLARISRRNRHAETPWGLPLAESSGKVASVAVSQSARAGRSSSR